MDPIFKKKVLDYHSKPRPGKLQVSLSKPCETQEELSMAYTPGVAIPCEEISKDKGKIWEYTGRGNSVAVISDGSAVLGLGDIGPRASLPVMEGKSVLFKKFGDVDAVPLILQNVRDKNGKTDIDKFISIVEAIEPTYGGINLEDIAAPACFELESRLKKETRLPIFHDDQHGTAIISLAGLQNGLEICGGKLKEIKVVINGAGAAGIACADYYCAAGVKSKNIIICDSRGVIYKGRRDGMNPYKDRFALETNARSLKDALVGADVFLGLSVGNVVTEEMVKSMADNPILFPLSNPIPEIFPEKAFNAGACLVATGRSDYPNQINNVLGFPGIFRGALDVSATDFNEEMKKGATRALAELAKEKIPDEIKRSLYKAFPNLKTAKVLEGDNPQSKNYIIPLPLDPRVVPRVARYVAEAAIKSKVSRCHCGDLDNYEKSVFNRIKEIKS